MPPFLSNFNQIIHIHRYLTCLIKITAPVFRCWQSARASALSEQTNKKAQGKTNKQNGGIYEKKTEKNATRLRDGTNLVLRVDQIGHHESI